MFGGTVLLSRDPEYHAVITPTTAQSISEGYLQNSEGVPVKLAFISVEDNPIRLCVDGTTAAADTGHYLLPNTMVTISGIKAIRKLSFIDTDEGASIVRITLFF